MPYSPTELEASVRQRAPQIARDIQAAAQRARGEADLVAEVEDVLKRFEKNFDLSLRLERERTRPRQLGIRRECERLRPRLTGWRRRYGD